MSAGRPVATHSDTQPDRLFYRIGEVSRLTAVPPYVLRYWESEFTGLRPKKGRGGQRLYTPANIETVRRIKQMLYVDGLKIRAARKRLRRSGEAPQDVEGLLQRVKAELQAILEVVSRTDGTS